jgi:hypothetical protein
VKHALALTLVLVVAGCSSAETHPPVLGDCKDPKKCDPTPGTDGGGTVTDAGKDGTVTDAASGGDASGDAASDGGVKDAGVTDTGSADVTIDGNG